MPYTYVMQHLRALSEPTCGSKALHNGYSQVPSPCMRSCCACVRSLAGVLQWQLLPLVTALLEETLTYEAAELANAKTLPAQDAMRDLYSAMSIVELQVCLRACVCVVSALLSLRVCLAACFRESQHTACIQLNRAARGKARY